MHVGCRQKLVFELNSITRQSVVNQLECVNRRASGDVFCNANYSMAGLE